MSDWRVRGRSTGLGCAGYRIALRSSGMSSSLCALALNAIHAFARAKTLETTAFGSGVCHCRARQGDRLHKRYRGQGAGLRFLTEN